MRRWLLLGLFWVITPIILLEIILRITGPSLPGQLGVTARYVLTGQPFAEDWTPAWQENRDHYYALRPGLDNVLQYGTATVSFRLTTTEPWENAGIGLRNRPVDYRVDAVVVGDSFGFCFTETSDCWVNLLEQQTGKGIVNLSQPVTGTMSHARMLQDFGAAWKPPLVIWQFFGNDFNDDYGLLQWRGDIEAIPDEPTTTETQPSTNRLTDWLRHNSVLFAAIEVITTGQWGGIPDDQRVFAPNYTVTYGGDANGRPHVLQFGKLYERNALDMSRPANQFGLDQSRTAFEESKTLVESWDGEMIVMIVPTREEVYEHLTEEMMSKPELDKHRSARLAMLELCDELELQCLDLLPELQERALNGEHLYYTDDMHFNPDGNRAVAEILAAWLTEQGIE